MLRLNKLSIRHRDFIFWRNADAYCYEHGVCLSASPSVTDVHCAKTVQDKPMVCLEFEKICGGQHFDC